MGDRTDTPDGDNPHSDPAGVADHDDGFFGERIAADYDRSVADRFAPEVLEPTVTVLADLAEGGRALEFAVGTGRVALPLAERGVPVSGIELSRAMVTRLRAKPGGSDLPVTIGDMATATVEGSFSLVFLVFNTITNLLTQDEQVACFANAAAHLAPGGRFVVEDNVPQLRRLPPGERYVPFAIDDQHLGVDEYDVVAQHLVSHHSSVVDGKGLRFSSRHRYAWPSEYDLMARLAGLTLESRWGGWDRSPFTADSEAHVSVWARPSTEGPGGR